MRKGDDIPRIGMLLDIENIFAENSKGLGRFILCICLMLVPPLIIGYYSLYLYFPVWLLVVLCIFWAARVLMIIPGREKERLANYKKIRNDEFASATDLVNIKAIHKQGCIEYVNGIIGFFVVTYNTTTQDVLGKSKQFNRFLKLAVGDHPFDFYIQNIVDTEQLENRYTDIKMYNDQDSAKAFMEIIDYNKQFITKNSLLTKNIIFVRGSKYEWKDILNDLKSALRSDSAKIFKNAYIVTDKDEIEELLSRDINGDVDINNLIKRKYCTGERYGSKVISYDYEDLRNIPKESNTNIDSIFIPAAEITE